MNKRYINHSASSADRWNWPKKSTLMQFLRKWHLQEALKSRSSIGNFLGEVVGKDEIGPKPYGTIAGVTLPGFLSISYISFPLRTHSNPLQVTWTDVKRSKVASIVANGGHLGMSDRLDCPATPPALFNPQMPRFPIFRVIKYSSLKFPMLVTEISPPPSHICVFSIFAVFLTNYSYSR